MSPASLSAKARARAIALRYGPAWPLSADEVLIAGVRYDEEDRSIAETFLLTVGPGRAVAEEARLGAIRSLVVTPNNQIVFADEAGQLFARGLKGTVERTLAATGVLAVVRSGDVVLAGGASGVVRVDADAQQLTPVLPDAVEHLALADAQLAVVRAGAVHAGVLGKALALVKLPAGVGPVRAVAVDAVGNLAAVAGQQVLRGNAAGLAVVARAKSELHAVVLFRSHVFTGSRLHGVARLTDDGLVYVKPSCRAHSCAGLGGVLAGAGDLSVVTTDDAEGFASRDLAPFVRIAEKQWARFL